MNVYQAVRERVKVLYYRMKYKKKFTHGKDLRFRDGFHVLIVDGGKVRLGNNVFFNNDCSINCMAEVTVGDNCMFGESVKIYDHNHIYADVNKPIHEQGFKVGPVKIGNNCWLGSNVTILQGVTIGDNCVIGANALIFKDVPSGSIVMHREDLIIKKREE